MDTPNKPLYALIIEHIQSQIESGFFKPDEQIPTEMELVEQFGVSRITTKRALVELERSGYIYRKRGSGSYVKDRSLLDVSTSTVQRSTELIASKRIISMILPYMVENRHVGYLKGVSDYLEAKGYYLSIHSSDWDAEKEKELLIRLPKHGFDGIILYPLGSMYNLDIVHMHVLNSYPLVMIDQFFEGVAVPSVISDNSSGGYYGTKHLIELGHKRIAYVSSIGIEYRTSVRDRYFGYCRALKEYELQVDAELVVCDFYRELTNRDDASFYGHMANDLIVRGATAVVVEHDQLALEMMSACIQAGIRIPEQLSFVGFDDIDRSVHFDIPLTTVRQNFYEIGRCAAELMVSHFEQRAERDKPSFTKVVPIELMVRQSAITLDKKPSIY